MMSTVFAYFIVIAGLFRNSIHIVCGQPKLPEETPTAQPIYRRSSGIFLGNTTQFTTLGENEGCCTPMYRESQVISDLKKNYSNVTATDCLDECENDPSCAAFDFHDGICTRYKYTLLAIVLGTTPAGNCTCYVRKRHSQTKCTSVGPTDVGTIACEYGSYISLVSFASLGPVHGSCLTGHVDVGICQNSALLPIVEQTCLGRSHCSLEMENLIPELGDGCQQCVTGPLTIEALCTANVQFQSTTTSTVTSSTTTTTTSCSVGSCAAMCQNANPVYHCSPPDRNIGVRRTGLRSLCYCDDSCQLYGDCCQDYTDLCSTTTVSTSTTSISSETATTRTETTTSSSTNTKTSTTSSQTTVSATTASTKTSTTMSSSTLSTSSSTTMTTLTVSTITSTTSQTSVTESTVTVSTTTISTATSTDTTVSTSTQSTTTKTVSSTTLSSTSETVTTTSVTSSTSDTSTTTTTSTESSTSTTETTISFCSRGTKSSDGLVCCPGYCQVCSLTGYIEFCNDNGTNKNPEIPCNPDGFRCTPQSYSPPYFSMPNATDPGACVNATQVMCKISFA